MEAAVVVSNLLEHYTASGPLELDASPAKTANRLIEEVWHRMPDIFEGKFGHRPHKLTVAGVALSQGIVSAKDRDCEVVHILILALGMVI